VQRALAAGLLLGDESWQGYVVAVAVLLTLDELDTAVRLYTEWLELARRQGSAFAFAHASSFRALALVRRGDLPEAEADARAGLDVALPLGFTYAHLAEVLAERGEFPRRFGRSTSLACRRSITRGRQRAYSRPARAFASPAGT
jgi:tetratricopeptide (TPR) repeat protein